MKRAKTLSLILVAAMLMAMLPTAAFAEYPDTTGHWAETVIDKWSDYGIITGDADGFRPSDPIKRGEFAAILNRVMKYQTQAENNFTDLKSTDWYYADVLKLNAVGAMNGSDGIVAAESTIERQQAFALIRRVFDIPEDESGLNGFSDANQVDTWFLGEVGGMAKAGYVQGTGGLLNPKGNLTRAEAVQLMDNIVKALYNKAGTYTVDEGGGIVVVNTDGVELKDSKVGSLYITQGIGKGDFTFTNSTATNLTVLGGGVNSINLNNSKIGNLIVNIDGSTGDVSIKSTGSTIDGIDVKETTQTIYVSGGSGTLAVEDGATVVISGDIGDLIIVGDNVTIIIAKDATIENLTIEGDGAEIEISGKVDNITIKGDDAAIDTKSTAKIGKIVIEANDASIGGSGTIDNVVVESGTGNKVTVPGTKITVGKNAGAVSTGTSTEVKPGASGTVPITSSGGGGGGSTGGTTTTYYTVTFNTNGGTTIASKSIASGSKITGVADPARDGFVFEGWYTDAACTIRFDIENDTVTKKMTLYAYWTSAKIALSVTGDEPVYYIKDTTGWSDGLKALKTYDGRDDGSETDTMVYEVDGVNLTGGSKPTDAVGITYVYTDVASGSALEGITADTAEPANTRINATLLRGTAADAYLLAYDGTSTFDLIRTGFMGESTGQKIGDFATVTSLTFMATDEGSYTIRLELVELYTAEEAEADDTIVAGTVKQILARGDITIDVTQTRAEAQVAAIAALFADGGITATGASDTEFKVRPYPAAATPYIDVYYWASKLNADDTLTLALPEGWSVNETEKGTGNTYAVEPDNTAVAEYDVIALTHISGAEFSLNLLAGADVTFKVSGASANDTVKLVFQPQEGPDPGQIVLPDPTIYEVADGERWQYDIGDDVLLLIEPEAGCVAVVTVTIDGEEVDAVALADFYRNGYDAYNWCMEAVASESYEITVTFIDMVTYIKSNLVDINELLVYGDDTPFATFSAEACEDDADIDITVTILDGAAPLDDVNIAVGDVIDLIFRGMFYPCIGVTHAEDGDADGENGLTALLSALIEGLTDEQETALGTLDQDSLLGDFLKALDLEAEPIDFYITACNGFEEAGGDEEGIVTAVFHFTIETVAGYDYPPTSTPESPVEP